MEYHGYAGKILYVDLTSREITEKPLDLGMAGKFLGGWGLSARLIYDLLTPGLDPLSPQAPMIIGAGPLCSTLMPGSGKCTVMYKRPVVGHPTRKKHNVSAAVGGTNRFATMLKNAGYDHVVITGRASAPCYLYIGSDGVRICDASDLWGRDLYDTSDELIKRHKRVSGGCGVWTTGRAGENQVKWAVGLVDKRGSMGRLGGGAILGAKSLKAVVTWGDRGIKVANRREFLELMDRKRSEILHAPGWGLKYPLYGGGSISPRFPREAWTNSFVCRKACSVCFGPEFDVLQIRDGRFAGDTLQSGFLWAIRDFISYVKIQDYREMLKLADLMNRSGLDYVTGFKLLGFLPRLFERGVISTRDTGGLELKLGDFDCYALMLDMIVNRKDIGETVAEGWYALGSRVGMEWLDDFAIGQALVKGHDCLLDARFSRFSPTTFGTVVFSKPQHTHVATHYYKDAKAYHGVTEEEAAPFLQTFDGIKWDFANRMATTRADFEKIFTENGFNIGGLAKHAEDCKAVYNSLGICDISPYGFKDPTRDIPFLAEAYSALTGMPMTTRELKRRGEAIWNLDRLINVREGFSREDDRFPEVWVKNTEQPYKFRIGESYLVDWFGNRVSRQELMQSLDDYYDERGWDVQTGIPTEKKVQELGLEEFA